MTYLDKDGNEVDLKEKLKSFLSDDEDRKDLHQNFWSEVYIKFLSDHDDNKLEDDEQ